MGPLTRVSATLPAHSVLVVTASRPLGHLLALGGQQSATKMND